MQAPVPKVRVRRFDNPADVVSPFVWVAAIAFAAGFWSYLAIAPLILAR